MRSGAGRPRHYVEPIYVDPILLPYLPELAPGVAGLASTKGGVLHIGVVIAKCEGSGDVGRYLDSLAGSVIVHGVQSARLAGMLYRRSFALTRGTTDWCRG